MKVYVENNDYLVVSMFKEHGFFVTKDVAECDVVIFTGGEDVNPSLYGESPHMFTSYDTERDLASIYLHNQAIRFKKPMVGICRGAQFLNVMQGGKLLQHIEGHAIQGTHKIVPFDDFEAYDLLEMEVTSTHHQAMVPPDDNSVFILAESEGGIVEITQSADGLYTCVQGHPEYMQKGEPFREWFIEEVKSICEWW